MNTEQAQQQLLHIGQEKLLAFVRAMIGGSSGREDDEHPLPPGPWDPVIRVALERISVFGPSPEPWRVFGPGVPWQRIESVFGPMPEPWKIFFTSIFAKHPEIYDALGGGHSFGEEVALNPQPLPPRFAFLVSVAQTVISRAELLQDIADATPRKGEQQSSVSAYIARFVERGDDEVDPLGRPLKWPGPGPRPKWWINEFNGIDLVVMAAQFEQAAKEAFSPDLRKHLAHASAKFAEAGLSKMR